MPVGQMEKQIIKSKKLQLLFQQLCPSRANAFEIFYGILQITSHATILQFICILPPCKELVYSS
jgi:hypothetical protein